MIEKSEIKDLSETENEMVKKAYENYGNVFDNANKSVLLIWSFFSDVKPEAFIFISFLSQVRTSLSLALLSTVRRHDVQTHMMLRNALESAVLACYALYKTNWREFGNIDDIGCLQTNDNVLNNAYKWLGDKYKDFSDGIKSFKDIINELFAHANLAPAICNVNFSELKGETLFFDKEGILINNRLWVIANISCGLLDLFRKVIQEFPLVTLIDNFEPKMRELGTENERIKKELMAFQDG